MDRLEKRITALEDRMLAHDPNFVPHQSPWSRFGRQIQDLGPLGMVIAAAMVGLTLRIFGVNPAGLLEGLLG